jgi:hypothetical protein
MHMGKASLAIHGVMQLGTWPLQGDPKRTNGKHELSDTLVKILSCENLHSQTLHILHLYFCVP